MSDGYRRQEGEEKRYILFTFELPKAIQIYVAPNWESVTPRCNYLQRLKCNYKEELTNFIPC